MTTDPAAITIGPLGAGDTESRHEMRRMAFGATAAYDPDLPVHDPARTVGAHVGDRLAGTVVTLAMTQTWGGRDVVCGGVSGVIVRPEYRGHDLARRLLVESLAAMADRGEVISALFPTTSTLYRSVGYETAGWHRRRKLALRDLPRPSGDVEWRQVPVEDPAVVDQYLAMAQRHDGWVRPGPAFWAFRHHTIVAETSVNRFAFIGRRDGVDVASLRYRYTTSDADLYDIDVEVLGAADGPATSDALAFIGGNATTSGFATFAVPVHVFEPHLDHAQRGTPIDDWPWMLRLVDAPGAVAARGVPTSVAGSVALDVDDPIRPANSGRFVLEIAGGESRLDAGGAGTVACSIQTLAALYGGADPTVLAAAGRLPGASAADLDVFAAAWRTMATNPTFF